MIPGSGSWGVRGSERLGTLITLGTWTGQQPKDTHARRRVESRVNQSLQGPGVSYSEEAGRGVDSPGAAHRGDEGRPGAGSREERRGRTQRRRRRKRALSSLKRGGDELPQTLAPWVSRGASPLWESAGLPTCCAGAGVGGREPESAWLASAPLSPSLWT